MSLTPLEATLKFCLGAGQGLPERMRRVMEGVSQDPGPHLWPLPWPALPVISSVHGCLWRPMTAAGPDCDWHRGILGRYSALPAVLAAPGHRVACPQGRWRGLWEPMRRLHWEPPLPSVAGLGSPAPLHPASPPRAKDLSGAWVTRPRSELGPGRPENRLPGVTLPPCITGVDSVQSRSGGSRGCECGC